MEGKRVWRGAVIDISMHGRNSRNSTRERGEEISPEGPSAPFFDFLSSFLSFTFSAKNCVVRVTVRDLLVAG